MSPEIKVSIDTGNWRTEKNTPIKKPLSPIVRIRAPEGSEVARLMETGMGCEPLAHMDVGVKRPKLGYIGSPLTHKQY